MEWLWRHEDGAESRELNRQQQLQLNRQQQPVPHPHWTPGPWSSPRKGCSEVVSSITPRWEWTKNTPWLTEWFKQTVWQKDAALGNYLHDKSHHFKKHLPNSSVQDVFLTVPSSFKLNPLHVLCTEPINLYFPLGTLERPPSWRTWCPPHPYHHLLSGGHSHADNMEPHPSTGDATPSKGEQLMQCLGVESTGC